MTLVIDASVVCKWFIEEAGSEEAVGLLQREDALIAPGLVVAEVGSVLWKKSRAGQITPEQAAEVIGSVPGFLDDVIPLPRLGRRALEIASDLDHPIYDCFYLALAEEADARMVTADLRLLERLAGSAWAPVVDALR